MGYGMINVPLTIIIAIFGVFLTARFQRYHWLRSTREEIRVRETNEASELVRDIARAFDKRITAQRSFLWNLSSPDSNKTQKTFEAVTNEYANNFNEIRYRLFYYSSYQEVLEFEQRLHDRIVANANEIRHISKHGRPRRRSIWHISKHGGPRSRSIAELDNDLSILSAKVFEYCAKLSQEIATENIGSLRRLNNWKDPNNEFITNWHLIRLLLNF